ncbi:MAG: ATP-binding protein [Bacteroidales bacterium]|nr:ATP-binding protein [Bacteroidales bacterium]
MQGKVPGIWDTGGTGLGLLVVKDLTKINKGTLRIKSKPGRGTSFIFTLPGKP